MTLYPHHDTRNAISLRSLLLPTTLLSLGIIISAASASELPPSPSDAATASAAAGPWNIHHSRPDRDGRFLSVPIYYGDWVPIEKAKAKIESLASAFSGVNQGQRRQDETVNVLTGDDFKDSYTLSVGGHYSPQQSTNAKPHVIGPKLPTWGTPARPTQGPRLPPQHPRTVYRGNGKVPRRPPQGMMQKPNIKTSI